jgi:hypothetical protein
LFHNKTWTIIPTLGSLRVYVHPWSGTVSFRFIPCSRYPNSRKCVHTPLDEESILANKHNPYTHLGAPLPVYPYKTRVGGSRSYEVPTTRSTPPKGKRCVCQVRFFLVGLGGFDQKCVAYTQDYPSSRKLRGDYFTTTDDRPTGVYCTRLLQRKIFPANRRCSAPHNIGISTLSGRT